MTESQLLERIDRHLERADGHMALGNRLMARVTEEMRQTRGVMSETREVMSETREVMSETREVMRDHRDFIAEITARQERVTGRLVDQIAANTRRIDAGTDQLADLRLATNQQTAALMRILDRLG